MSPLNKSKRAPLLCYVTDRSFLAADSVEACKLLSQKIVAATAAGVDWIQIREKDLSARECSSLTRKAQQFAADPESSAARRTRILLNDRLDIALATKAGGVHLGEKNLPPEEVRRLVKSLHREEDFLIGVSCHSLEAAKTAGRGGADYLIFGPVFTTPSKAAYGAPQGLNRLAAVCQAVALPVLAIGGITLENASTCISAGASGIAAIRLFQDAPDLAAVVRTLQERSA
jgi:thiamine-phosphate pyrophosphorylase